MTTTAKSLSKIRAAFVNFYENPQDALDMSSKREYDRNNDGSIVWLINSVSLESVTGLKKLGSGMYATAYALDEKRVLKVIKSEDTAYDRYINKVCRPLRAKGNPFVPAVKYQGEWAGKRVYILERLSETDAGYNTLPGWREDMSWNERARFERDNRQLVADLDELNRERSAINKSFRQALEMVTRNRKVGMNMFMQIDPRLQELGELLKEHNTYGDIHAGNIMFRGDTPVLTDPSCD